MKTGKIKKTNKNYFCAALFLIFAFAPLMTSCQYALHEFLYRNDSVDKRAGKLNKINDSEIPMIPASGKYSVLIMSDVHFGAENQKRKRREEDFFTEINNMAEKPLFAISLGDIAEHGYKTELEAYKKHLTDELDRLFTIKTYNVVGNHDLYNSGWRHFKEILFPHEALYKFSTKNFSWYFIDSASNTLGKKQSTLLINDMKKDEKSKFVFAHVPFYADDWFYFTMQDSTERNQLLSAFAKNNVNGIFTGHTHIERTHDFGTFTEYTLGGYFAKRSWGILHVDEDQKQYSFEFKSLPNPD